MTEDIKDYFARLLATKDITAIPLEKALLKTAHLVDLSSDFGSEEGAKLALRWSDTLEKSDLTPGQRSLLQFYRANAWDSERKRKFNPENYAWAWEQTELREQLLSLRRAVNPEGLAELEPIERVQILTNLGNQLNSAGRFVEAGEYWGRAIAEQPRFAMALANRGSGWHDYARAHYDPGHQRVFLYRAHQSLAVALADDADWGSAPDVAREFFVQLRIFIAKKIDVEAMDKELKLDGYGLGRSQTEREYRQWALDNRLFLNPLNDLGTSDVAAQDVLSLPSYRTPIDDGPTLIGFFNQMKQEFASARWLLFEGIKNQKPHFSDRDTRLHDTLDDPGYSLSIEKTKLAFRSAYSLLDKVAFFLNDYLTLGIPLAEVSFRSLWFEKRKDKSLELKPVFTQAKNWPLRGLYWLAKDFVEQDFRDSSEPDARDLATIRNHLEHRYLKVRDRDPLFTQLGPDVYTDRLALFVDRHELEMKALRILKLARAAMIYLCFSMHQEETIRTKDDKGFAMPMTLPPLEHKRRR
ncbi:LA2681 family HEPN domain-containing protein [Rhodopseudomonas sp. BAL398]|uniref:LA2681 family HEPN domain-containing protein n=1 Tax=Rhodopseudomonas sp. BAL398 TaxID=3034676 RepID=UPI0023E2A8D8|nr:LA2681 family HEPN domain-containing protein [Rhodopseudomonas sp. BAL398]MDF3814050.1 LA2681 family HEPN domain-containing protein [Rhodopseudomonas sp. BAL398]